MDEPTQIDPLGIHPTVRAHSPVLIDQKIAPQINGYNVIRWLGEGGMGTVWEAEQMTMHRRVALKVLRNMSGDMSRGQARFTREVELAARLTHPNIARVYDSGLDHGVSYYTMELIDGAPLDHFFVGWLATQDQVLGLFEKVCQAIGYAHDRGIIHRDIKPSNILVTREGQPMVLDFGLAKAREAHSNDSNMSVDGELIGTPSFMSPEQAAGRMNEITAQTDVYSLGVTLYQLLTGELPFRGAPHLIIHKVLNDKPPPPRSFNDAIPRNLEAIVLKAIAKEPRRRYASVAALAEDLARFRSGQPVQARPMNYLSRLWLWCQRRERITEPASFAIGFGIIFTIWNFVGMINLSLGLAPVAHLHQVLVLIFIQNLTLFGPMIFAGVYTKQGKLWALWAGTLIYGALLYMTAMNVLGKVGFMMRMVVELDYPLAILLLFLIISLFGTAQFSLALVSYYANRNVQRWSKAQQARAEQQGPPKAPGATRAFLSRMQSRFWHK